MLRTRVIKIDPSSEVQRSDDRSFIGGTPALPSGVEIPKCRLCGHDQTFFMQVAFPEQHVWEGLSLAIFACTSCFDENHVIPEMLSAPLLGAHIPLGFLDDYQRNFRFVVFDTEQATPCSGYRERVVFKRLMFVARAQRASAVGRLGGAPKWFLGDENPGTYGANTQMRFLLQIAADFTFSIYDDAPRQIVCSLDFVPEVSTNPFYRLFWANAIYLFGTCGTPDNLVYAITQTD